MATVPKGVDPRVKRTRQLLQQAFLGLLQEKGFSHISIQDITERATVNRGTFYAHFADKLALMDSIVRDQFHQVIASKLPAKAGWDKRSLGLLIQAAEEYIEEMHAHCGPPGEMEPLFERTVQEELAQVLVDWLKRASAAGDRWPVPVETIALVASWGIFGAAVEWSQGAKTLSAERMANDVLLVISEGVMRLNPGTVPDE
ncbi:MAG TPA: TetR/AcrR family transcriptional regulator [Ktedonobacterales bacterium]